MIGAPVSCHLLVQFQFFIDKATVIESETFEIHIHNMSGSIPARYIDGQKLARSRSEPDESERSWEPEDLRLFNPRRSGRRGYLSLFDYVQAWPSFLTEESYYYEKGSIYFRERQYKEAIVAFEQVISLESDKPSPQYWTNACYYKGVSFYQLQRYEEALTEFRRVQSADYSDKSIRTYAIKILMELGRYDEAKRLLLFDYSDKDICTDTMRTLAALGRYDEAQQVYEMARRHGMIIARIIPPKKG
jgi:tetratricopeptide (TPR) repeat protein